MTEIESVSCPVTGASAEPVRGCPVTHTDYTGETELYGHYELLAADQERARFLFNDSTERGFFMVQRYDDVREGFQQHATWTTAVRSALRPGLGERLLPQDLNGDEHVKMRRVLNQFFAPAAVRRMEEMATARCIELIEELKPAGSCDFVQEFAIRYPTDLFLALLGLPVSDGDFFLEWSEDYFTSLLEGRPAEAADAKQKILDYFDKCVNERRENPGDPNTDMVSRLISARIDDQEIEQADILTIMLTLMLAGLDTTRSALGYIYAHLANNDEQRREITENPEIVPKAVEEFLRANPLVFQAGREVAEDGDFNGLEVKQGDVIWLGVGQANRDPEKFPNPGEIHFDRDNSNQHLAFGGGPHRCLGMHLARLELRVVLEEWHKRIPNYRIAPGTELRERGAQLTIPSLPLEWEV